MSIAIFGAGILGTCTALELADRGHRITVERNAEPLSEASLYNEGKLHLGFVYAAPDAADGPSTLAPRIRRRLGNILASMMRS